MIQEIRGQRIILDSDLARIYGVAVKALNQAVKRNAERFPDDFAFRLTNNEWQRGQHRKFASRFTEHGAIMAANVLNSKQAVQMSVFVVRAFVKLREMLATHKELAEKLTELERKVGTHDKAIVSIIAAIRGLTEPVKQKTRLIGFRSKQEEQRGREPEKRAATKPSRKK